MDSSFNIAQSDQTPPDEESLVALVTTRCKNAEPVLQELHRQWFVNIAMRRGQQYIQLQPGTGLIVNPSDQEDRVRIVVNKMSGIHQTRVAKLIKDMPKLECLPASSQDEDKDLARKGTKMLSWVWHQQKMVEKIIDAAEWAVDTGNGFFLVRWDAGLGTEIPTYRRHEGPITEDMGHRIDVEGYILDAAGQRIEDKITTGDVAIDFINPFCVINDGAHTNIQDSDFIIVRQAMSLKDIRMRWPERGHLVSAESDLNTRAYYQRRLMALTGNQATYFTPESKQFEEMSTVDMMWERASDRYPKGRRIVTANGVLLEAGDMPYAHGLYPLIKISDLRVSGSFWDVGMMELCVPLQKGCNRVWSQIIENGNALGNVKAWTNKGHGLSKEAYDDTGYEILELNQGFSINQLQPASLPAHVINQLEWYDRAFEDVTGQHEVSNARVPAGVRSGRAVLALQEQDDTRLAPTKMRLYRAIEEIGYQVLQLYAEYQTEDREYQLIGSSSNEEINEFRITPAEIKSMKKDVRVQSENVIAAHKRLQQDQIVDLYTQGLFGPQPEPAVRKKVLELLEFGNVAEIFDEVDMDTTQARRENQQFINREGLQSLPNPEYDPEAPPNNSPEFVLSVPAYDFEDHEAHIRQHNKFRKSPRYRQLSDAMRKGIDLHVKAHEMFLARKGSVPEPKPPGKSGPPPNPAIPSGAGASGPGGPQPRVPLTPSGNATVQ